MFDADIRASPKGKTRLCHCFTGRLAQDARASDICIGLCIMEGLNLQLKHVDLVNGILRIEHVKFDKDRLIPLAPSIFKI